MEINHIVLPEMPNEPIPWNATPDENRYVKLQANLVMKAGMLFPTSVK